jgi:hypothetical protein
VIYTVTSTAAVLGFPTAVVFAITRYHLFDIDIIIRKTLVYALLTGLLVLVYYGGIILADTLTGPLGGQHSTLALILSTLAIAALFNPLRRRVQTVIDRRFYRSKYNAEQALEEFRGFIRNEVDLDAMNQALQTVAQETLQPESVSLWLQPVHPGRQEGGFAKIEEV